MRGPLGVVTAAVEPRLATIVYRDGGLFSRPPWPGADWAQFALRVSQLVLMMNGKYDYLFPLESLQDSRFRLLGSPAAGKRPLRSTRRAILPRRAPTWSAKCSRGSASTWHPSAADRRVSDDGALVALCTKMRLAAPAGTPDTDAANPPVTRWAKEDDDWSGSGTGVCD